MIIANSYPTRTRGIIVKYILHFDLYVARFYTVFEVNTLSLE